MNTLADWDRVINPPKRVKQPSLTDLEKMVNDDEIEATDGCNVELDGECEHGKKSWLLELGLI